jgi:hypothetical protein
MDSDAVPAMYQAHGTHIGDMLAWYDCMCRWEGVSQCGLLDAVTEGGRAGGPGLPSLLHLPQSPC